MKKIGVGTLLSFLFISVLTAVTSGNFFGHFFHLLLTALPIVASLWLLLKNDSKDSLSYPKMNVFIPVLLFLFFVSHVLPLHALAGHVDSSTHQSIEHPCCMPVTSASDTAYVPSPEYFVSHSVSDVPLSPILPEIFRKLPNKSPPISL